MSFQGLLSLVMLCTSDVYTLIDYSIFIESMFIMFSVAGLLWLRYKEPDLHRPIKVHSFPLVLCRVWPNVINLNLRFRSLCGFRSCFS